MYIYRRIKIKHIFTTTYSHVTFGNNTHINIYVLIVEMMILHVKQYTINVIAQPAGVHYKRGVSPSESS